MITIWFLDFFSLSSFGERMGKHLLTGAFRSNVFWRLRSTMSRAKGLRLKIANTAICRMDSCCKNNILTPTSTFCCWDLCWSWGISHFASKRCTAFSYGFRGRACACHIEASLVLVTIWSWRQSQGANELWTQMSNGIWIPKSSID